MPLFRRKAKTDAEVLKEQEKKEKTPWHKRPASTCCFALVDACEAGGADWVQREQAATGPAACCSSITTPAACTQVVEEELTLCPLTQTPPSSSSALRHGSPSSRPQLFSRPSSSSASSLSRSAACSCGVAIRCVHQRVLDRVCANAFCRAARCAVTMPVLTTLWLPQVKEFTLDYTNCANDAGTDSFEEMPSTQWSYSVDSSSTIQAPAWQYSQDTSAPVGQRDLCRITFDLPVELTKPVFMYYKREWSRLPASQVVPRSERPRLITRPRSLQSPTTTRTTAAMSCRSTRRSCMATTSRTARSTAATASPWTCARTASSTRAVSSPTRSLTVRGAFLCHVPSSLGAHAVVALGADTFTQPILLNAAGSSSGNVTYNMTDRGIAWPGEHEKYKRTKYSASQIIPPPYWAERYPDGYTDDNIPDLTQDEHFQVWMRTAGLPTFRKLYYRNDDEDMPSGRYEIDIYMSASRAIAALLFRSALPLEPATDCMCRPTRTDYPVRPFGGTKSIVFSTVSFIGGKNPFLGIAYIAVGGVCVLLGLLLTLRHLIKPRKLGDPQVRLCALERGDSLCEFACGVFRPEADELVVDSTCRGTVRRRIERPPRTPPHAFTRLALSLDPMDPSLLPPPLFSRLRTRRRLALVIFPLVPSLCL